MFDSLFQLRVTAFDTDQPDQVATEDVTIEVQRNAHAPTFTEGPYRVSVSERATLGEPVATVTAEDEDGVSLLISWLIDWLLWFLPLDV